MAAALECWSSRATTAEDDMVEQVLMRSNDRSEDTSSSSSSASAKLEAPSAKNKRFQRLSRNVSEAIASLKNSLNLDTSSPRDQLPPPVPSVPSSSSKADVCRKVVWGTVVRNLTQLYPGSQLPEKLASGDDHPAIFIQQTSDEEVQGCVFKLTFACNSSFSWSAMSGALDSASICCKKIQIFEKKGFTLGIILFLVQSAQDKFFKSHIESALKSALRKPKTTTVKLPFGLCGCQEESTKGRDFGEIEEEPSEQTHRNGIENPNARIQLPMPLPSSSFVILVDEWQTIQSGADEIGKWLLNSDSLEFIDQIAPNSFKGVYKGKRVGIEKLKGCDKGNSYEFELRKDLLELMTCGHRNILQFYGVCVDENNGLCVVTKLMEGGSVHDLMLKNKKLQIKEIMRIAADVAEGIKFMNDHGVAYKDLNTQRILLDKHGNACLADMGIVTACKSVSEAMEYETDGYRWLAPEIIAGDPENVTETWMSNSYSFGMVIWEMVTGEAAYSACSPVQAAVGIAACGLRPDIPKDCPQILKSLMTKCWNSCPSKRPQFSEILSLLLRTSYR
ncbi:receptor like protein kinase S.2-like [Gossypium australe]|uniref:Receptor like protein kinase S.2-like n=1 Tax=Gossypium australe TaxID=47621 RepID=A0A5B6UQL2_9ROSI|nr:receptor like protein kinase S.2-like [Gossypium australe]